MTSPHPHPHPDQGAQTAGLPRTPAERVAEAYRLAHEAALILQIGADAASGYSLLMRAVATNMLALAGPTETAELLTRLAREAMTQPEAS